MAFPGGVAELILFGYERDADFHDGSLLEIKRRGGNQNAITIARPDFARRGFCGGFRRSRTKA